MTQDARVAVVVPNYNGRAHLDECLTTLAKQDVDEPFETILVDNASTDDSVDHVRANYPDVRVEPLDHNRGYGAACNHGARSTRASYVAFLNNDVRLPRDWLRELVGAIDAAQEDVIAMGSLLLLEGDPPHINHRGAKISPLGGGYDLGFGEPYDGDGPKEPFPSGAASGGAMLVRRDGFLRLGGFDESFFMYFEDADLGLRSWIQGYRHLVAPRSVVVHKFGGTVGGHDAPIRLYWGTRNQVRMMLKAFSLPKLVRGFTLLPAALALKVTLQFAQGNPSGARLLLQAAADAFADVDTLRHDRMRLQQDRRRSDRELRRLGVTASAGELFGEFLRLRRVP